MKDFFKKVADALDNMLFTIPCLQLDDAQKKYLDSQGYKTTRNQMPVVMSPYTMGCPMIEYDHISRKDGRDLTNQEYRALAQKLETMSPPPASPEHKL